MPDDVKTGQKYDVGGVLYDRPFRVRRLGHFGIDNDNFEDSLKFYMEMFGFKISERIDFGTRMKDPSKAAGLGDTRGAFLRAVSDHHMIALFPRKVRRAMGLVRNEEVSTNHFSFHVDSLQELADGYDWITKTKGLRVYREGRDALASNYHIYFPDPDFNQAELCYGMEQVGWDGYGKPWDTMYPEYEKMTQMPLPQPSEEDEVTAALKKGVDVRAAGRSVDALPAKYNVGGILLGRPFKIAKFGAIRLFATDVAKMVEYYEQIIGLTRSEEVNYKGHRCVFLRAGTEHHCLAIYPIALRAELGLRNTYLMSFGLQLSNYRQLKDARTWLAERGATPFELPKELTPGIDYCFYVRDPDGHVIEVSYYMEQVGWDGRVRSPAERRQVKPGVWPETLEPLSDTFVGAQTYAPL